VSSPLAITSPAFSNPAPTRSSIQAASPADPGLKAALDAVVAAGVPGALLRVQEGHETEVAAAGVADLATSAALRPQARFRVGSITKTFVATVVLQLVGEQRLALDRPVGEWLPGLLANGDHISVRELLNHTSGLFNYTNDPRLSAGVVANRVWDPKELVAMAEDHPASFPPGSAHAYSNTNYVVAGLLIEAVTHHRLAQELGRRIFQPLDLEDTSFPNASGQISGYHAHGYVPATLIPTPDGKPFDVTGLNPSWVWGAGNVVSSAEDLSRFYRSLMGGKLLSPRLLQEMKTTVAIDPADPTSGYGLGIGRVQTPCGVIWGHDGAVPGYEDAAYWNESTGRTVVVAETMYPTPLPALNAYINLVALALCGPGSELPGGAAAATHLMAMAR
jgi:D-alanyl-D-alanine carboxypeptidase